MTAPRPRPRSSAVTVPPCSATRLRDDRQAEPEPAAASDRAPVGPARRDRKCAAACRRAMPMPVSATLSTTMSPSRGRRHADHAAGLGVLRGVGEQIRDDLRQARSGRPARQARRAAPRSRGRAAAARAAGWPVSMRLAPRRRRARPRSRCSWILPLRDARDVEQVVDQADQMLDLALDDRRAPRLAGLDAAQSHQLQRRQDRRQRIAQLVTEHREELVLRAVRRPRRSRARCQLGHLERHDRDAFDRVRRDRTSAGRRSRRSTPPASPSDRSTSDRHRPADDEARPSRRRGRAARRCPGDAARAAPRGSACPTMSRSSDELQIERVRQLEDVLGPAQDGDRRRRVREHGQQPARVRVFDRADACRAAAAFRRAPPARAPRTA